MMNMTTNAAGDYGFGNQHRKGFRPPIESNYGRQVPQQNHLDDIDFSIIRPEDRRNGDMTMNTIAMFEDFEVMGGPGKTNGP